MGRGGGCGGDGVKLCGEGVNIRRLQIMCCRKTYVIIFFPLRKGLATSS